LFRVPEGYDGHRRLLNLHGSGLNRELQMQFSQMEPAADAHGFAVAAPNGAVRSSPATYEWNVPGVPLRGGGPVPAGTPNDEQYLLAVIRAAKHAVCIDTNRIYVAGYSGGGRMSSQLACDYADKIAAIAPVAGLRAGVPDATSDGTWEPIRKTCRPDRPVPILAFHGTADPRNPYDGNGDPSWGYSVETALARWAKINRCERGPRTKITTGSVEKISYRDCQAHGKVGLYRANGAGHTWPGSPFPFPVSLLGTTDQTISATELMLDFFAKHPQEN
jgi:polyhydroxybutyrate depolymerase